MATNIQDSTCLPLQETIVLNNKARTIELVILSLLVSILIYRVVYFKDQDEYILWLLAFLCESWFTFNWILLVCIKWDQHTMKTYPDRLLKSVSESEFPAVDIFVTTADLVLEPPIITMNTVLSLLAVDYPADKLALYLSDDGCSPLIFYFLVETTKYAKVWVPFCKKYNVQVRAPFRYFNSTPLEDDSVEFQQERKNMKNEYEELYKKIDTAVQSQRPFPFDHDSDFSVFYGVHRSEHPTIIKVVSENKERTPTDLPHVIYISREKSPKHHHHYKAGAMNVLTRVSGVITNAPLMLNVDCDMYVNNPQVFLHAMCMVFGIKDEENCAFYQFIQAFYDGLKDDPFVNQLANFFGMDHFRSVFTARSARSEGKSCFTWMGTKPVVHVYEPTMIREVFTKYNTYQKPTSNPLTKLLINGLINVEGDQWVKHRKIINPAFHVEKLKHMIPAFYVSCSEMIHKWEKVLSQESSCEVDVWPYLQTFTSDVISRTAFGSSFEEGRKIFELQREQAQLVMKATYSVYIPGSRFLLTRNNKRMKEINQQVRGSIKSIINKRIVAMKAGEASHDDLLGILLDSNYKEIKQHGNSNFGLSIEDIIEDCKLFYLAGQETTTNMLAWTMILLGQHMEWQTRARDEVFHVFRDKTPDIEGLSHLKVMNIIFNEVLRLYSPVPLLRRLIHDDTNVGNLTLPAGTLIQINALIFHHDKDMWGEDVNEFKPERFSEGVSKVTKGQAVYIPFGGGPRICIGQNFAILEAKMALSMILKHFSFELSPSYSHAPHAIITLQPQFGAHLILHKL